MEASVRKLDPKRVAFIRHRGPYAEVGPVWQRLTGWAGAAGVFGPDTEKFGMTYDDPDTTPPEKIRYDACITIGPDVVPGEDIDVKDVPAGRYATAILVGSYEGLAETYDGLLEWISQEGLTPTRDRPCLEFYLEDPASTPVSELRTEVCIPLTGSDDAD